MNKILKLTLLSIFPFIFSCNNQKEAKFKIGISQIVSHNALDQARKGFKDAFKEANIDVKFIETNANSDMATLELNSRKLVNQNVDLLYAISTPSAQSLQNATKDIPIIFSAVTSAKEANLINENITGILDSINLKYSLDLLLEINPNIKKLGFLYNSNEQNSLIQLKNLKKIAKEYNIEIIAKSANQISEISQNLDVLLKQSDALLTPSDNLIASSARLIGEKALEHKKISIASEKAQVDEGMLMCVGYDYYNMGKKAGKIAIEILTNNKKTTDFKIKPMEKFEKYVNRKVLKELGLEDKWKD